MLARRSAPQDPPPPVVVAASQDWDGNDGPWSTFTLQVGTPAQDVKVLVSTSGYQIWTVAPQGCTSTDPPDCAKSRGFLFDSSKSTSWNNVSTNSTFAIGPENRLGYQGNGLYGYDSVALGWQGSGGPKLEQQVIAGIATKDFYLGVLGLDPRPTNFTDFEHPIPSFLTNLLNQSKIPSLAWGYTAGNQYRGQRVLGSLTLGGYDASRFVATRFFANPVTFPFNQVDARALTVTMQEITFEAGGRGTLLLDSNVSLVAVIDSMTPYIYLPRDVCQNFERAFGLTWNDSVQAYLVNETLHSKLQAQNANVTFSLGAPMHSEPVNISLPYAAFDLVASYPLLTNRSRYFPLMRADNESQYTLGRTFLQEAYLTVDYERRYFSVSQCDWSSLREQDIVSIVSPSYRQSNMSAYTAHTHSSSELSKAEISGIVAGSIVCALLASLFGIRKRLKLALSRNQTPDGNKAELDTSKIRNNEVHLLDGEPYHGPELESNTVQELEGGDEWQHELVAGRADPELPASPLAYELPSTSFKSVYHRK